MMTSAPPAAEPAVLTVCADGGLTGRSGAYDKYLGDLAGVYSDDAAYTAALELLGFDRLAYHVDEMRPAPGSGALIIGTSSLLPGRIGEEFAVTRGHLHARADRSEMYHCISGMGVVLLDTLDGDSRAVPMSPGDVVYVPGDWVHRSVNVGDEPFVTIFCYPADAGQDYQIIADAGGMTHLVVREGMTWAVRPNPRHIGYQVVTA